MGHPTCEKNPLKGAVMNCMEARADLLDRLSARDPGNSDIWLAVTGCIEADDENFSPLLAQQITHIAIAYHVRNGWIPSTPVEQLRGKGRRNIAVLKCKERLSVMQEQSFRSRCSEMKTPIGALTTTTLSLGSVPGAVKRCLLGNLSNSSPQKAVAISRGHLTSIHKLAFSPFQPSLRNGTYVCLARYSRTKESGINVSTQKLTRRNLYYENFCHSPASLFYSFHLT